MAFGDYKVLLYRNQPLGWVAEIPSIAGCYALMPTRAEALAELEQVLCAVAMSTHNVNTDEWSTYGTEEKAAVT